jgi:flagellar hook protein FlgE
MAAHQTKMDVIGNNIANVNTYGYKSSRVTFSDIYYQNVRNATGGSATVGGNNASQVGYGVTIGSIDTIMSRSGFQMTDNSLDLAIAGEGFFQVQDKAGNIMYTRAGVLNIDDYGNLVDMNGNFVLGITGDPSGQVASSNKIQIVVPNVDDAASSASKTLLGSEVVLTASAIGEEGNLTVNFVHGTPPTATLSGTNLTVNFDQTANYPDLASLQAAINQAIQNGGITLPSGALNLSVDPAPTNTLASAANTIIYSSTAAATAGNTTAYTNGDLTISAGADGIGGNAISVSYTNTAVGPATAAWAGNTLTFTLVDGDTYTPADLQTLADAAATTAGITDGEDRDIQITGTATSISTTEVMGSTVNLAGGIDSVTEQLTVDAGAAGTAGNSISINYATVAAGGTASAAWAGNILTFTLVEGDTYDATALQALADAADTAAGITAGDVRDVTFSGLTTAIAAEDLAALPFTLTGGDNTYFTNIAGRLGTMKLEGGRTSAEQTVGNLSSISVGSDGVITATHSVHGQMTLGRIDLVTFDNPSGLEQYGNNYFVQTDASGDPRLCQAGFDGSGDLVSSALEMSNVDLSQEFADMITTQRGFQANARIITTSDQILEELVNLKR